MTTTYKYYKNSNTGELIKSQEFTETTIKGIPVYWYDSKGVPIGENLSPVGFVEISERKFNKGK